MQKQSLEASHRLFLMFAWKKVLKTFWKNFLGDLTFSSSLNASPRSPINLWRKPNVAGRGDFRYCSHWLTWLASSVWILHSNYLHMRLSVIVTCICSIECTWSSGAQERASSRRCLCNKEMRTFSHIRTHQSTSETFDISLWKRKRKPAAVNYSYRHCGSGDEWHLWCISVTSFCLFGFVEHHVSKMNFHHNVKKNLFHMPINIPAFSGTLAGQRVQRPNILRFP